MTALRTLAAASALALLGGCGGGSYQETAPPEPAAYPAGEEEDSGASETDRSVESTPERLLRNAARATYRVYVADGSSGRVHRVGFVPGRGARLEGTISTARTAADPGGARGIAVSPRGDRWYVSVVEADTAGSVLQLATGADTLVARTAAGRRPAAMELSADGGTLFVAVADGGPEPSHLSVVRTSTMTGTDDVTTCVGPRGGRIDAGGAYLYSTCAASEQLVQVDVGTRALTKRFSVAPGREGALPLTSTGAPREVDADADRFELRPGLRRTCSPTWAEPGTGIRSDRVVYVACSGSGEVLVVSTARWEVADRHATGAGTNPHHLESTADGRYLLAALSSAGAVAVFDLDRGGEEVARIETSAGGPHGVVASPDARYAFVTNEGSETGPGSLDVLDLRGLERVATVELDGRPGAVGFWEIERLGR